MKLLGGPEQVLSLAEKAFEEGDVRWSIHLLAKLEDSGLAQGATAEKLTKKLAAGFEKLAEGIYNTNGRAYLLESAAELSEALPELEKHAVSDRFVTRIPLENIFFLMASRLIPGKAMDVHESIQFVFPDEDKRFIITVRRGIAEIVEGEPLPGTPAPVAVLTFDSRDYRRMALNITSPVALFAKGKIKAEGSWVDALAFLRRFDTSM